MTRQNSERRAQRAADVRQKEMFVWSYSGEPYPGTKRHYFGERPPPGFEYKIIRQRNKRDPA